MGANSRFTVAIHILAWMALVERKGTVTVTSDRLAVSVNTNPVVIRRLLGQLRRAGLVSVQRGAGAGFRLTRPASQISLLSVHDAVEPEPLFAMHAAEPNQACPVGRGIQPALGQVYERVDGALRHELEATTISDVLNQTLAAQRG
jgi:Rrf2 family protein